MIRCLVCFLVPVGLILFSGSVLAQGTPDDPGMMLFNNACRTCHSMREGDNRLGPNLYGILGRKSGTTNGYYGFSSSMKQGDIVWDEKNLEKFIANPEAVVPGNGMKPYSGLAEAHVRAKIVDFIKACASCGPNCPAPKICSVPPKPQ